MRIHGEYLGFLRTHLLKTSERHIGKIIFRMDQFTLYRYPPPATVHVANVMLLTVALLLCSGIWQNDGTQTATVLLSERLLRCRSLFFV